MAERAARVWIGYHGRVGAMAVGVRRSVTVVQQVLLCLAALRFDGSG